MRFLFIKTSLVWPRSSGHDVHGYHMMRALGEAGHEVALATIERPTPRALDGLQLTGDGLKLSGAELLDDHTREPWPPNRLKGLQERYRSYWGIEPAHVAAAGRLAQEYDADAVVVVGLEVLPLLGAVEDACRVWYAADESVWHHLSVFRIADPSTWPHVRAALVKGGYEFAFRSLVDRTWVVSPADRRAMRWLVGMRHVDVVPNGVDSEHYAPVDVQAEPNTCVFWGRLDFEPNVQALEWFCHRVWPQLRREAPEASFRVFGFAPGPEVARLSRLEGVTVTADLPDLREEISRSQVVVLPFQSGGGIKNKLLEAASMARPIVCSRRACNGLVLPRVSPLVEAGSVDEWVREIRRLWRDSDRRRELGAAARRWVIDHHSWQHSAELAIAGLRKTIGHRVELREASQTAGVPVES